MMNEIFKKGFSYETKQYKNKVKLTIFYHDIDIYNEIVSANIKCDVLAFKICSDYLKQILK